MGTPGDLAETERAVKDLDRRIVARQADVRERSELRDALEAGDAYSYDIFSQGAKALLNPTGVRPLGDLHVKHLIAIGESQSAIELDDYIRFGADVASPVF